MSDDDAVSVGRIGPVHGVRGEVLVEPWTDQPEVRFAAGAVLMTEPASAGPLTVDASRLQGGRLVVHFAGVFDRAAAAQLRGVRLLVDAASRNRLDDPDEFYDTDLIGLQARRADGVPLGPVLDVVHVGPSDYLVVEVEGVQRLVPFVAAIVTGVDVGAGWVEIDPPEGLFDL